MRLRCTSAVWNSECERDNECSSVKNSVRGAMSVAV